MWTSLSAVLFYFSVCLTLTGHRYGLLTGIASGSTSTSSIPRASSGCGKPCGKKWLQVFIYDELLGSAPQLPAKKGQYPRIRELASGHFLCGCGKWNAFGPGPGSGDAGMGGAGVRPPGPRWNSRVGTPDSRCGL